MSLRKAFAQVVGGVVVVGVIGGGTAFGLSYVSNDNAAAPAPSSDTSTSTSVDPVQHPAPDVFFNLMTPLFDDARYQGSIESDYLALRSRPDLITITGDTPEATIDQIVQNLKDEIINNGGPLNRIIFSSDGFTNQLADPLPKHTIVKDVFGFIVAVDDQTDTQTMKDLLSDGCVAGVPGFGSAFTQQLFCTTPITSILHALVDLQNQEFPGHKAGEPLGQAIDIAGCDVFATNVGNNGRFPAREISQLAAELNMPIIGSATLVMYNQLPMPIQITGDFWAILPNGNVAKLEGPRTEANPGDPNYQEIMNDDVAANEAWIYEDGFIVQPVAEPDPGYPFSVVNTPEIANPNVGKGPVVKIAIARPKAPGMG